MRKTEILAGLDIDFKQAKFIENNTIQYTNQAGERVIRHFHTDILTFHVDRSVTFNSGGYRTRTTKSRMNEHQSLAGLTQENRVWYVYPHKPGYHYPDHDAKPYIFKDDMRVWPSGKVKGAGVKPDPKLVRKLRKYSKAFADALPVNPPSAGDCIYCGMVVKSPQAFGDHELTLGDVNEDTDHLLSHVNENYFVPSMLYNAMQETDVGDAFYAAAFKHPSIILVDNQAKQRYAKWLFDYLYTRIVDNRFETKRETSERFAV